MKAALVVLALMAPLAGYLACYPKDCKSDDTSCWPCTNAGNTNPACAPFPSDVKKPDSGVTK